MPTVSTPDPASDTTQRCDCGADVPREDGPVHAYLHSAPACWRMYGELIARAFDQPRSNTGEAFLTSHVDCYATQHIGGVESDRRQRQSVAVHLVALSFWLDHGIGGVALARLRGRTSDVVLPRARLTDWPILTPPDDLGPITAPRLYAAAAQEFSHLAEEWPRTAWRAWTQHHDVVRRWAAMLLAS